MPEICEMLLQMMVGGSGGRDRVEVLEGVLKKRKRRSNPSAGGAQAAQGDGAQGTSEILRVCILSTFHSVAPSAFVVQLTRRDTRV